MSTFSTLKLTAAQKPTQIAPVVVRRNKLAKRIWEQQELLKAQQAITQFRHLIKYTRDNQHVNSGQTRVVI